MTPELWQRVREQFDRAKDLAPDKRRDFLRRLRTEELEVAIELEKMLAEPSPNGDSSFPSIPTGFWQALSSAPAAADETIEPTDKWIGPYQIVEEIDTGGMGIIYRCKDHKFRRSLALKLMRTDLPDQINLQHRFQAEAEITAQLQHAGILPIYDFGRLPDGRMFYVMKLIRGRTLAKNLEEESDGTAWPRLLSIFEKVCEAVAYAHSRDIISRDLKPQNIMIDDFGVVQVIDWGLAKMIAGANELAPATANGAGSNGQSIIVVTSPLAVTVGSMGTPAYMSPEQANSDVHLIDKRSDVFALGAILCEILTGAPPYVGDPLREILPKAKLCELGPVYDRLANSGAPIELIDLAKQCLAKQRENRLPDAAAVAERVTQFQKDSKERLQQAEIDKATAEVEAKNERGLRAVEQQRLAAEERAREEAEARAAAEKKSSQEAMAREKAQRRGKRLAFATAVTTAILTVVLGVVGLLWHKQQQEQVLREQAENLIANGEKSVAARPEFARDRAIEVQTLVADRGSFSDVKRRADDLLQHANELIQYRKELEIEPLTFMRELDEAEFHILGGLWTLMPHEDPTGKRKIRRGENTGSRLDRGIELTEQALRRYALPDHPDVFSELSKRGYSQYLVAQLRDKAADGIFLLALAVERVQQGSDLKQLNAARDRAIQLLDMSERLGNRTRSLFQARAKFWRALDRVDLADRDEETAAKLTPVTFFDHHLLAGEKHRAKKYSEAAVGYQLCLTLRPTNYWTLFRLAKVKEFQGLPDEAVGLYQSCISLRDKDPTAFNNRGELLHRLGSWKEAIPDFRRAIERDPEYFSAVHNLMLALAELKDFDEARKVRDEFRQGRKLSPAEEAELLGDLGIAYERARKLDDADKYYSLALDEDLDFVSALRNRGNLAISFKRFKEGEKDLKRAIALEPQNGELVYILGNLYAADGQAEKAVITFQQAIRISPTQANAVYNQGVLLRRLRHFKEAVAAQAAVLSLPTSNELMHLALYERAMSQANLREFRSALNDLDRLLALDPTNVPALIARGQVRADLSSDLEGSEQDLGLAIRLAPTDAGGYRARGITRARAEKWQGVIEDYRQYLKLRPDARDAESIHTDISTALLSLGKVEEAEKEFGLIKTVSSPSTLSNRGNLKLKAGAIDKAIADFAEAIAKDKNHTRTWALRGQARLRKGQFDEAAKDFAEALRLGPRLYETLLFSGLTHYHRQDAAAARSVLREVAKDRPDHMRGRMAQGILHMLDQDYAAAITDLTPAVDDPIMRPFALLLRARAWIEVGGPGLKLGLADAESYRKALPADEFAQLEAARIRALVAYRLFDALGIFRK